MSRPLGWVAGISVTLMLVAGACGAGSTAEPRGGLSAGTMTEVTDGTDPTAAESRLARAIAETAALQRGRVELRVGLDGGEAGDPPGASLDARIDFDRTRRALAVEARSQGLMALFGAGGGDTARGDPTRYEARVVEGQLYLRLPGLGELAELFGGPSWLSVPLPPVALGDALGGIGGEGTWDEIDPGSLAERFATADASVEVVGDEQAGGVAATRLAVRPASGGSGHGLDVWIGDDGLVRRLHLQPDRAPVTVDVELFDLADDERLEAPPDDELLDGDALAALLELFDARTG